MRSSTTLELVDGFHYLFLGVWLGAIVMLAVGAPITFRTVRQHQPALQAPPYNQPELADRAAPILAGAVVGNSLRGLSAIQVVCALGAGVTLAWRRVLLRRHAAGQSIIPRPEQGPDAPAHAAPAWDDDEWNDAQRIARLAAHARTALLILAVAIVLFDRAWLTPRVWQTRAAMYDPDQTPAMRDQARARFDSLHKTSERLVTTTALSLAVALVLSPLALRRHDATAATDPNSR